MNTNPEAERRGALKDLAELACYWEARARAAESVKRWALFSRTMFVLGVFSLGGCVGSLLATR
jgi:hypothetical protein